MSKPLAFEEQLVHRHAHWKEFLVTTPFLFCASAYAQAPLIGGLADLSIEDLATIQITSVSKKEESLADAAASVFVITPEDIRRSGATSIPDALRLAPNLHVAQSSASAYSITARGFNGSNTTAPNKLLVLIDGRTVYTPLYSGVFWDVQDVMLEDIERIEVISGPGGTLWGINAVNGVINIITRSANDTRGQLAAVESGNRGTNIAFRHGGTMGAEGNYRIYGKYLDRQHLEKEDGSAVTDAWHKSQLGFRADWERSGDQFSLQGNVYDGAEEQPESGADAITGSDLTRGMVSMSGANLTTHWTHLLDDGSTLNFQGYYDRTKRTIPPTFDETLDMIDLQLQHSLKPIGKHALTWGANYRYSMDRVDNLSPLFAFLPDDVNQRWISLFAQDEVTLRDDLRLTVGARIERNDYTGKEFLPNARLAWKVAPDHLLWSAVSRAVRAPSRLDRDAYVPATPPFLLDGGREARSEIADVVEVGYRGQPAHGLSYSVTAFHAIYDHLRTLETTPGGTLVFASEMEGKATGIETWGTYQASPNWRLSAGYTALKEWLKLKPGSNDIAGPNAAGNDPAHTWQLRSTLNIAQGRELEVAARHVATLANNTVPSYTAVDARFGWKVRPDLELSVTGKNLFGDHAEYGPSAVRSEIPRSIYVKLLWKN